MRVKVKTEIYLDIPGELQDDDEALRLIDQTLRDMLYVGIDYDEDIEDDFIIFNQLEILDYLVLSGRLSEEDMKKSLYNKFIITPTQTESEEEQCVEQE
jgi:hypothetical protein